MLLVFIVACKSKAVLVDAQKETKTLTENKIISNYYKNNVDFSTLQLQSSVRYTDPKQSQNVSADIKIKKNEQILVNIKLLGFPVAKALITPTSVSYYEKLNRSYFQGDFSSLSVWLGTDLDFYKLQNMLLGLAIDDLRKGTYQESNPDNQYLLEDNSNSNTKKSFYIEPENFRISKQEVVQIKENRKISVAYSDSKSFTEGTVPLKILIQTLQAKGQTEINLNYNSIIFNQEISFPYTIPDGYKRILIK